jgi:predicted nucleic acid-binding protein
LVAEFTKPKPNEGVVRWLKDEDQLEMHLSCITIGEISKGIEKLDDGLKKNKLSKWLHDDLQVRFQGKIISLDSDVMMGWGKICGALERSGINIPIIDSLIAACAIAYDLTLVTKNSKDFKNMNIKMFDPWI